MKIRVADFIADFIYRQGVKEIFMVSGGGLMFLSDGVICHPKLKAVCNHHEQASAMAAASYAKYNENLGVVYVTTGCGGTNAITGLLGAWQDNVPCLFISGQSKRQETIRNSGLALRQFGVQEADIVSIVSSLVKYVSMINNPEEISYHLEKAVYLAKTGRPGPVWLDIPLDVQGTLVDKNKLKHFDHSGLKKFYKEIPSKEEVSQFISLLSNSQRPIIICGQGIRLAKAIPEFRKFIEDYNIPVVASRLGIDILPSNHPLFIGRIGNKGDRAGNFAVSNADLIIAVGSRLSVSSTGHEYDKFGRGAKKAVIDIDPVEHQKNTVKIDLFINADAKIFFNSLRKIYISSCKKWVKKCQEWKRMWPIFLPEYSDDSKGINLYYFTERLSRCLRPDSIVISDAGSAFYVVSQGIQLKKSQRYITSGAQAEMGYTLPACIGVSIARNKKEVIGITGDGSVQMNIQELQTIKYYKLPVKLFVWNNDGYLSIRATQAKFFSGRFIGTDKKSGVSFPELQKIAKAYGIKYFKVSQSKKLDQIFKKVMNYPEAVICEVICIRDQEIVPTVSSCKKANGSLVSRPLEDMYPFLTREEFNKEMIIKPLKEK